MDAKLDERLYSITELAKALGITPRTIRFYETKGLISPQRVGQNRVYTARDRARMILILRGKQLGFSLRDIKEYLDLYVVDRSQVHQLQMLLSKVRSRIGDLEDQRQALETTLKELQGVERQTIEALLNKGAKPDAA